MTRQINNSLVMNCEAYQNGVNIGDVTIEDISQVLQREHTFGRLGGDFGDTDPGVQLVWHEFQTHAGAGLEI